MTRHFLFLLAKVADEDRSGHQDFLFGGIIFGNAAEESVEGVVAGRFGHGSGGDSEFGVIADFQDGWLEGFAGEGSRRISAATGSEADGQDDQ